MLQLEYLPVATLHLFVPKSQLKGPCLQEGLLNSSPESFRPGNAAALLFPTPSGTVLTLTMPQQCPACLSSQPECRQGGMGSDLLLAPPNPGDQHARVSSKHT